MKAICKNNNGTFKNRLTNGKSYDVIKRYIDDEIDSIIIVCDNGQKHTYHADRFYIISERD